jgi:Xaa-Pro aminopeptidase
MGITSSETGEQRIQEVKRRLDRAGADALILSPGANQYYLSGNRETQATARHTFLILRPDGAPLFFCSTNNADNIREMTWVDDFVTWDDDDDPVDELERVLSDLSVPSGGTVLVDDHMWATFVVDLQSVLDPELALASDHLTELRMRKDERELDAIERAARIADDVSEEIRSKDIVGMTENEVSAEIEYLMRQRGAEDTAFDTVVASGPNSARPSHTASRREIRDGDVVIFDFGAQVDQYLSDQKRTLVCGGTPPDGFEAAYDVVRKAQKRAIDAVEPGVEAQTIDKVARSCIREAGYGEYFLHLTGHGIGLGIHEPPFLMSGSYVGGGNEITLQSGMVITVEPGVYLDEWGVGIEDDFVVTESGSRRLTHSARGWRPL